MRHGRSLDALDDAPNVLADDQPALASLYDASAADRELLGGAPGQTTRKLVRAVRELLPPNEALADVAGILGCRERDGALERRLPCFAAVLDPEVLREQLDEQLRARSDRLPVLDLGAMLRLRAFGDRKVKTLELVDAWVTAEDGILAIDAHVR